MTGENTWHFNEYDAVLDLCSDFHRRIALATLSGRQEPVQLTDLANSIAYHTQQVPIDRASDAVPSRVQLLLHHTHLPKLAEAGLVEYDPEQCLIEPTSQFQQLQPQLSAIVEADPDLEPSIVL